MTVYFAYGARLDSELPMHGLPPSLGGESATVRVLLEPPSQCEPREEAADAEFLVDGRPLSLHAGENLEVCWKDVVRFRMSLDDSLIRCARSHDANPDHVQDWLLHYALPLLLAGMGRLHFLHGSAVQIGRRAVGFLAASGGGKTTLAEYFLQRGHRFLTDEKLGVVSDGDDFTAVPSTPFYRRCEESPRFRHVTNFAPTPLPIDVFYVLAPASGDIEPTVTPVPAPEAAFELARRCEFELPPRVRRRLRLPSFRVASFQFCTQLAAVARVRRLVVPRDRARLQEVYELVVADSERAA